MCLFNYMIFSPFILFFIYYFYFSYIFVFYQGLKKINSSLSNKKPTVSVVIAVRNEEKNILRLLTSLLNQSYSQNLYEVIIADDNSSDKTNSIVKNFAENHYNFKLVNVEHRDKSRSPKKNALAQAIKASSNEIILTTDADCTLGKYWIEAMVTNFTDDIDMVVGFSQTNINNWEKAKYFQKFEYFDFLAMFFAAAGAISSGKIFSCSGQNLAYKRSAFDAVEGFEKIKHLISGDDLNLMQLFRKNDFKIKFSFTSRSFVKTQPIKDLQNFINQRSRWASNTKWQIIMNFEFFLYLLSVLCVVFIPIILLFSYPVIALILLLSRIVGEFSLINLGFKVFNIEKKRSKYYPIWFFLQPFYMLSVAIFGLFGFFKWKV